MIVWMILLGINGALGTTSISESIRLVVPHAFRFEEYQQPGSFSLHQYCNSSWQNMQDIRSLGLGGRIKYNRILNHTARFLLQNSYCGANIGISPWNGPTQLETYQEWVPKALPSSPRRSPRDRGRTAEWREITGSPVSMIDISAMATGQQHPVSGEYLQSFEAGLAPPPRAAEPYTIEHWAIVLQPRYRGANLLGNRLQLWARSNNGVRYGNEASFWQVAASGFDWLGATASQSLNVMMLGGAVRQQVCAGITLVDCPRRTFDPDCTPMDVPIPLNDTCRQTVLWPKTWGEHQHNREEPVQSVFGNCTSCPSITAKVQPESEYVVLSRGEPGAEHGWVHTVATCSERSNEGNTRPGIAARARTAVWTQTVTTVWPPGTVAVLPVGPNATASGDFKDYPWRVNRAHVVTVVSNVPSTRVPGSSDGIEYSATSYNSMRCGSDHPDYDEPNRAQLTFLDDTSCIASRSCRPAVGSSTNASSPQYRQAVHDYVASDIAHLFPTGMVGCALAYDMDREYYTTDILPVDMPLAQNGAGFAFGGFGANYIQANEYVPALKGRWNQSDVLHSHRLADSNAPKVSSESIDAPVFPPGAIHGPYALYRGPVPHRMLPPSPNATLPPISRGRWACARTAPQGYFQERPHCLAVCDDPSHIAVDVGLERDARLAAAGIGAGAAGAARDGWALVASQARHWYSYWLGYPGLVQDERLYGNDRLAQVPALGSVHPVVDGLSGPMYGNVSVGNGSLSLPSPSMSCEADDDDLWHRSWSRSSRWAQRLPESRGYVYFDLSFDASTWPASIPLLRGSAEAPGLDWPTPSDDYLRWLVGDVAMDLDDLSGCRQGKICFWHIEIVSIHAGDPSGLRPNCSNRLEKRGWCRELPMRIRVRASPTVDLTRHSIGLEIQRLNTIGSILQRACSRLHNGAAFGLAGVWVMALDPSTVHLEVSLPRIRIFANPRETSRLSTTRLWFHVACNLCGVVVLVVASISSIVAACCACYPRHAGKIGKIAVLIIAVCARFSLWLVAAALMQADLHWPGIALLLCLSGAVVLRAGQVLSTSLACPVVHYRENPDDEPTQFTHWMDSLSEIELRTVESLESEGSAASPESSCAVQQVDALPDVQPRLQSILTVVSEQTKETSTSESSGTLMHGPRKQAAERDAVASENVYRTPRASTYRITRSSWPGAGEMNPPYVATNTMWSILTVAGVLGYELYARVLAVHIAIHQESSKVDPLRRQLLHTRPELNYLVHGRPRAVRYHAAVRLYDANSFTNIGVATAQGDSATLSHHDGVYQCARSAEPPSSSSRELHGSRTHLNEFATQYRVSDQSVILADRHSGSYASIRQSGEIAKDPRNSCHQDQPSGNDCRTSGCASMGWSHWIDTIMCGACILWAILCTFGACPTAACMRAQAAPDLAQMPWALLVWDRVAASGVSVVLGLIGSLFVTIGP